MSYEPVRGGTILIPSGSNSDPSKMHLHVILNDECVNGMHAIVSLSRLRGDKSDDLTCVLLAGTHSFVKEKSYAVFRMARVTSSAHIIKCISIKSFIAREPLSEVLVERLSKGVLKSKFTPRYVKDYFRELA